MYQNFLLETNVLFFLSPFLYILYYLYKQQIVHTALPLIINPHHSSILNAT